LKLKYEKRTAIAHDSRIELWVFFARPVLDNWAAVGKNHYSAPVDFVDRQVPLFKMQSMKLKSTHYKNG